ncbi:hypothetical protein P43SY_001819 [Pythium insidiosum]|uniref:Amino acid permease/ SLC12A domain-containing protein n=1 Tax=Pythium insidiosum TaxID=114742 RepID=A0AAD5LK49_PYTIN|nr:hypothetical protein P43SY_001819 [Pythium insidiosum]
MSSAPETIKPNARILLLDADALDRLTSGNSGDDGMHHQVLKSPRQNHAPPGSFRPPGAAANRPRPPPFEPPLDYRVLGPLGLLAIAYFTSCGGFAGSEPIVSAGGPLLGITAMIVYAVVCQIPFLSVVTELSTAFPENGGFTVWVLNAFGPFWGFQVGYWWWIGSVVSNAVYPNYIYGLLRDALGIRPSNVVEFFIKVLIAVLHALPSLVGVRCVSMLAVMVLALVLVATMVFTVWGLAGGDGAFHRLGDVRTVDSEGSSVDWSQLINNVFWSFDGIYAISVIGGEVMDPAKNFAWVLRVTFVLTLISYVLPMIGAVVADQIPWQDYDEDSYLTIGKRLGGKSLNTFLLVVFALALAASILLLGFDLNSVVMASNVFGVAIELMIFLTFLQLRRAFPYLPRPTRVPGPFALLCALLIIPTALGVYIFVTTLTHAHTALIVGGFVIPGAIYGFFQPCCRQSWYSVNG